MTIRSVLAPLVLALAMPALAQTAPPTATDGGAPATESGEVEAIVRALAEDEDHAYLRTLAPEGADCAALLKTAADAARVCAFADAMYAGLDEVPTDAMKPLTADGRTLILRASPSLIEAGGAHPVFAPYGPIAPRLAADATLYAFVFVDAEGAPRKARQVLFRGAGDWVFVPRLNQAFED